MKKIFIYILVLIFIIFLPTTTKAGIMDNVINSGDNFLNSANETINTVDEDKLKNAADDIYNILLYVGIAISVIIGSVLGIQMVMASAEDKAKVKEALIPYIIGCFVIFGAFGFWKLAITIFNSI